MLRQLVDYAYKYSNVALALLFDGLTLKEVAQLGRLAELIEEARDIRLKVYMVTPDPSQKNLFYVRDFNETSSVWAYMHPPSKAILKLDPKDPDSTIGKAVENLIKHSPLNQLKDSVCTEYTRKVSKVQI